MNQTSDYSFSHFFHIKKVHTNPNTSQKVHSHHQQQQQQQRVPPPPVMTRVPAPLPKAR